jgi:outer membrane protein W
MHAGFGWKPLFGNFNTAQIFAVESFLRFDIQNNLFIKSNFSANILSESRATGFKIKHSTRIGNFYYTGLENTINYYPSRQSLGFFFGLGPSYYFISVDNVGNASDIAEGTVYQERLNDSWGINCVLGLDSKDHGLYLEVKYAIMFSKLYQNLDLYTVKEISQNVTIGMLSFAFGYAFNLY